MSEYRNVENSPKENKNLEKSSLCSCPISSCIALVISFILVGIGFCLGIYLIDHWSKDNFLIYIFCPCFFIFAGISVFTCPLCGRISIDVSNRNIIIREFRSIVCLNKTYEIKIDEIANVKTEINKHSSCFKLKAFDLIFTLNNGNTVPTIEGEIDVGGTRKNIEDFLRKFISLDKTVEVKNGNELFNNSESENQNSAEMKEEKVNLSEKDNLVNNEKKVPISIEVKET